MSCLSTRISELTLNWFCANRSLSILRAVKTGFMLKILGTDFVSLWENISAFSVNYSRSRVSTCAQGLMRAIHAMEHVSGRFIFPVLRQQLLACVSQLYESGSKYKRAKYIPRCTYLTNLSKHKNVSVYNIMYRGRLEGLECKDFWKAD